MSEWSDWPDIRDRYAIVEDDAVLVLNKPAGVSVVGERHDTDLMRLAREHGEWVMPAHRIDKVTSGAVVLAKRSDVHAELARQFNRRSVHKAYLVITRSHGIAERGTIDLPLSVGRKSRMRVAAPRESITEINGHWSVAEDEVFTDVRTYPSRTAFAKVWEDEQHTLLVVRPFTGRRHQIRVQLAWIGHPIDGDPLFDKHSAARGARTCLHSWQVAFDTSWADGSRQAIEAAPEADFWTPAGDGIGNPVTLLSMAADAHRELDALPM